MRNKKQTLVSLLVASIFATTIFSNGVVAKADVNTTTEAEESTLSLHEEDLLHATGLTQEDFELFEEEAIESKNYAFAADDASLMEDYSSLPSYVDNSQGENGKYFPEVGNQGGIGSCLAWSDKYYNKTYMYNRYFDREVDETNTFSPKWGHANTDWLEGSLTIDRCPITNFTSAYGPKGHDFYGDCEADHMEAALSTNDGNVFISCGRNKDDEKIQVNNVNSPDVVVLKERLAAGSILELATDAYWFNYSNIDGSLNSENAKYNNESIIVACANKTGSNRGGHAMNIVGYDDNIGVDLNKNGTLEEGEMGAFKVVNSWGKNWGNKGFVWMAYDSLNEVSSYSNIGTAEGEERESITQFVTELIFDDDHMEKYRNSIEPDRYCKYNVTSKTKSLNLIFLSPIKFGIGRLNPNHTVGIGGGEPYSGVYNYRGEKNTECDATIVKEVKKNSYIPWNMFYIGNAGYEDNITLNNIIYVDNVEQKAYSLNLTSNQLNKDTGIFDTEYNYLNNRTEIPYISNMDVSYANDVISVISSAKDTAGGMTYSLSYENEATNETGVVGSNTTGNFEFVPAQSGYYRVKLTATDSNGKTNSKTKLIDIKVADPLVANITSVSEGNPYSYVNMTVEGGTAPYTYSFVYTRKSNGEELDKNNDMPINGNSFGVSVNTDAYAANHGAYPTEGFSGLGINNVVITVKDANGKSVSISRDIEVKPFEITGIETDLSSPQKANTAIKLTAKYQNRFNGYISRIPLNFTWKITNKKTGEVTNLPTPYPSDSNTWTPTEEGSYTIEASAFDSVTNASYSIDYTIKNNKTIVYYSNPNWSNANIHFKTENGSWTEVPGVRMLTSDDDEYTWMYEINLSENNSESVEVCFNNGEGSWDSKNATNYHLGSGVYGIKNGNIENINLKVTEFTIDKPLNVGIDETNNITCTAKAEFGSGNYLYKFGDIFNGKKYYKYYYADSEKASTQAISLLSILSTDWFGTIGTHTLFVEVTDVETGKTATKTIENFNVKPLEITSFTSNASSSVISVGTSVTLNAITSYEVPYRYNSYTFTQIKDGVRTPIGQFEYYNHYSRVWTPTEAGNYTIEYAVHDGYGQDAVATLNFTVVDNSKAVIYYNNDSWSQANIHYMVDGSSWTEVPGVSMIRTDEKEGYNYKFVIDLNGANGVTVCFNDGNGNWDSRYGANYYVHSGVSGIKNGSIYTLD